ncbi:MAG: tetratricopeptide repeat protein [Candidatus Cloacimonetes bacterium]|nr:tetratricopeptide repeat protein [Candidatus Cloacimonadota bacterium]
MKQVLFFLFIIGSILLDCDEKLIQLKEDMQAADGTEKTESLIKLAEYYREIDINISLNYSSQALDLARKLGSQKDEISAMLSLADNYLEMGDYVKVIEHLESARKLAVLLNNPYSDIELYKFYAKFQSSLGNHQKSNEYYFKVLDLAKETDDRKLIAQVSQNIGVNYRYLKVYSESMVYQEQALQIYEELDNYAGISSTLISIGKNWMNLNDHERAMTFSFKALELSKEHNDYWTESIACNDIAWNYLQLGDIEQAIHYNKQAYEIRLNNEITAMAGSSAINIGKIYLEQKKFKTAEYYFELALEHLKGYSSQAVNKLREDCYFNLSGVAEQRNENEKALQYYKKHIAIRDSLDRLNNYRKLTELQTRYEVEKIEKENELLIEIQQLDLNRQKTIIYGFAIIFLLSILLIFFILNRYRLKHLQNEDLARINQKLNQEIDERVKIEKILNAHQEHVKLINKILRHDLANDLSVMKSGVNVFLKTKDEKILEETHRRIDKSVQLINRMREFEKFMTAHSHLKVYQISKIVEQIRRSYPATGITLRGECEVMADETIDSVFENIISNAIVHGDCEKIEIDSTPEDEYCKIMITNNGRKIPDNVGEHIFEEGFSSGKTGNTGLGLFIVRKAVESYGGEVTLDNNQPGNVVFAIKLRRAI